MSTGKQETCLVVIKDCPLPLKRRVTERTVLRQPGRVMVWARRCGVVGQMASHACRSKPCKLSIHVTCRAGDRNVSAHQRELRGGVIERCRSPRHVGVARGAVGWKACRYVAGVRRCIELLQMTADTGRVQRRKGTADMARDARHRTVSAGEGKSGPRMIESRALPLRCRVTGHAILREPGRQMIRRRCPGEVL